ncbi:hypothetical protein (nucleomorph) [Guillardia theta]|uniref:Uncharacterized protein n=1 Tax=Guillardia theta TaxID=55529 RepID=Q98SA1_GUITH|nr:hypothetical protein GTHECHR3038 [Guillardia theta]AAK39682.1 hypothetical protein [Guillardia theta]|mmetsp:Transcript_20216/g.67532  ORF Transcript_20216/g.67532 Transcript_20216/m.67532 type:complete len:284 (+) Transcript_20216:26-877(+)
MFNRSKISIQYLYIKLEYKFLINKKCKMFHDSNFNVIFKTILLFFENIFLYIILINLFIDNLFVMFIPDIQNFILIKIFEEERFLKFNNQNISFYTTNFFLRKIILNYVDSIESQFHRSLVDSKTILIILLPIFYSIEKFINSNLHLNDINIVNYNINKSHSKKDYEFEFNDYFLRKIQIIKLDFNLNPIFTKSWGGIENTLYYFKYSLKYHGYKKNLAFIFLGVLFPKKHIRSLFKKPLKKKISYSENERYCNLIICSNCFQKNFLRSNCIMCGSLFNLNHY